MPYLLRTLNMCYVVLVENKNIYIYISDLFQYISYIRCLISVISQKGITYLLKNILIQNISITEVAISQFSIIQHLPYDISFTEVAISQFTIYIR